MHAPPLTIPVKLAYGVGQFAEGVKNTAFSIFLLFYYNQVLGLGGAWTGLALGIATMLDAFVDPLMGSLSDSFRHRWGRRHLFMYVAVLPLLASFALLFYPPAGLGQVGLFTWLLGCTIGVRMAMTLYGVPHMALGAELSTDYGERTSVVAYRNMFSFVGGIFVIAIGWGWFFRAQPGFPDGQLNGAEYPSFGVWCAIFAALSVAVTAIGTHSRIAYLAQPHASEAPFSFGRLRGEMREALSNASFRALFFGVVLLFVTRGVEQGLGIYMFTHFWHISPADILAVQSVSLLGLVLGTVVWVILSRRIDKRPAFLAGVSVLSVCTLLPPLAKLLGYFPARDGDLYVPLLATLALIGGLGAAAGLVTSGSMMADIADEHELQTGRRQEGIFFGALLLAVKSTSGLGQFVAGWGLDLIDFPIRAAPGTVSPETVDALGILYGPGIALIAVASVVVLTRYRIDRTRHEEIAAALLARRLAGGGAPVPNVVV